MERLFMGKGKDASPTERALHRDLHSETGTGLEETNHSFQGAKVRFFISANLFQRGHRKLLELL